MLKILNKSKQVISEVMEAGTRTLFKKGIGDFMLQGAKAAGWGMAVEAPTEGLTVLGQNGIDVIRGAKTMEQITENVDHAMVVGGMIGSVMSASPYVVGATYSLFSDYNSYEGYRKNAVNITKLKKDQSLLTPESSTFKIIQEQINDLEQKNYTILDGIESKITNKLDKEGYIKFNKAIAEQEVLRKQNKF